jgi:hypothetical protein
MSNIDPSGTVAPGFEGYLTDMLNRAWGLAQQQFQPYTGHHGTSQGRLLSSGAAGIHWPSEHRHVSAWAVQHGPWSGRVRSGLHEPVPTECR